MAGEKPLVPVPHDPWPTQYFLTHRYDITTDEPRYELTDEDAMLMGHAGALSEEEVVDQFERWAATDVVTPEAAATPDKPLKTRYVASVTPLAKKAVETLTEVKL